MERAAAVRYQPTDKPPAPLAFGLGLQQAALCVAGIVLTPAIVVRAAGGSEAYLSWAVFAALVVSGVTTVLQSVRLGPIGAGYPLLMGTSAVFIAVSIAALADGGPGLLATLVLCSAASQFVLAARLAWLRRVITPTVAGTVIMLIAVTVMPIIFDMLKDVPADAAPSAGPVSAGATLLLIVGLAMRAKGWLRLWVPVIGLVAGCGVGAAYGLYDFERVAEASWIGLPDASQWPAPDLRFGPAFWTLLPMFLLATWIGAIETVGDATAVQDVSWRHSRATDYREVQGAVAADGIGNALSGLAGTVPNTTYSSSIAVTELTGIAARTVGIWIGVVFIALAFLPKAAALLLAMPAPVVAAFVTVLLAMLFVLGMRMVVRDGVDYRASVVVGVSFWVGVGFQQQVIFGDQLHGLLGDALGNGMASGGLTAILLTLLMQVARGRRAKVEVALAKESLPAIHECLRGFAGKRGWSETAADRLRAVAEEAMLSLVGAADAERPGSEDEGAQPGKRLVLTAWGDGKEAELEFRAAPGQRNLEDLLAVLSNSPGEAVERELSLRLLRHHAAAVRHQQYHSMDILTVRVDVAGRSEAGGAGVPQEADSH